MKQFKHILFAAAVVSTRLLDLFIYDLPQCQLDEHIVAEHIKVIPEEKTIRLYSHDGQTMVSDYILIQPTKEYHIKENGKETVIRQVWGHIYQYEGDKVKCSK